ncbi:MAG: pitrilysin family protein [Leptolyngbyaceae bacterium]|nr:pitrilysin family protein [Leptolyngbyaceae bacterium]
MKLRQSPWRSIFLAIWASVCLGWGILSQPALADTLPTAPPTPQVAAATSIQPYLDRVKQRVTEFRLANGLKFIVLERHQAPVISFLTYANVGGADEPEGQTGVAHFLEHLAFKGTTKIGTTNYPAEQKFLKRLDQLFDQIQVAKAARKTTELAKLKAEFNKTKVLADSYIKQNELSQIVEQAGGVGLNASTSVDATNYFYSFPSNKLELWMSLESERFLEPVFREFHEEKAVILEERRLRVENSPTGKFLEAFLDRAYTTHPYRRPVIGSTQDIENLRREDVQKFFETYYVPNNLTIALVGDVNPDQVKQLAQIYFGRYPAKPAPPTVKQVEPPQTQPRELTMRLPSQPMYVEAYHRPAMSHPDHVVYEMIGSILSDGRTSRLYRSLVENQQVALSAAGFSGYPGDKYPTLMLFYALTAPGRSIEQVAQALEVEIERLKTEPVSAQELDRVKTQVRAGLLGLLSSNMGMASSLLEYEVKTGNWRNLFRQLDAIAAITPADVQRVAQATFRPENRTIGRLLPQESQS